MRKLLRRKKLFFSVITLIIIVYSIVTDSDPQTFLQSNSIQQTPAVQGIQIGKQEATVVKVVDGDTLTVTINGKKEKIRVIGVNTPETVDPRRGVQCFGKEASAYAKDLLSGKTVQLEADPSQSVRDRYGRLLRHIWIDAGKVNVGQVLISEGYGHEYTYETPHKYQQVYQQAEQTARDAKKGLWADTACAQ